MSTTSGRTNRQRFLLSWGCLLVVTGLLCNEWLLGAVLSSDGSIDDPEDALLIRVFQGACFLWGSLNIAASRFQLAARLNLSVVALLMASPLLVELGIRGGIALGIKSVCRPGLYADPLSDDDYWKLRHLWSPEQNRAAGESRKLVADEQLGWAPDDSGDDGFNPPTARSEIAGGPPILFYGDSFVEGNTKPQDRIPQIMNTLIADRAVYNLGVSGYGVDQIYLNVKQSHVAWESPTLLIGMLTVDIDRSVLRFRERPKPYFLRQGERLTLHGVPVTLENDAWIRQHPPAIGSFLYAFAKMRYRLHQPGPWRELQYKRGEKIELNQRLFRELVATCRDAKLPCHFVVFYEPDELDYVGWREPFILASLRELDADVIDTKPILLAAAEQANVDPRSYYLTDDHLNALGNRIVAEAVVARLQASVP